MVFVKPFNGVRYNLEKALLKNVIAPPYDVISNDMKAVLRNRAPYNIVRLILPSGKDCYENACRTYKQWKKEGVLLKDEKPSLYIYEQGFELEGKSYVRTGFVGLVKLEEFGKGHIFPHEKTLSAPKEDRLKLMKACRTNFSQIFGLYLDKEKKLESLFAFIKKDMPTVVAVDDEGVKNSIWQIYNEEHINYMIDFMKDKNIYIADGHHRYETSLDYRDFARKMDNSDAEEIKPYDFTMMMFVNFYEDGLKVFPIHRIINIEPSFGLNTFVRNIEKFFDVEDLSAEDNLFGYLENRDSMSFIVYIGDKKICITVKDDMMEKLHPIYRKIDTYVFQEVILKRVLKYTDEMIANKKNIDYINNVREFEEVSADSRTIGFMMKGINIDRVREVSENGLVMPQKSTFFYPKLKSGLIINDL